MRTLLRWTAGVVALVAGLTLGSGTANASTTPHSAQATHAGNSSHSRGLLANDWWW